MTAVTYAGLHVFEADGKAQSATVVASSSHVRFVIQDRDAQYPMTIDPVAQEAYLKASNAEADDHFGAPAS